MTFSKLRPLFFVSLALLIFTVSTYSYVFGYESPPLTLEEVLKLSPEQKNIELNRYIQFGHAETVKMLLDHGANVDEGETPLTRASADGRDDIVQMLLDRGADINVEDEFMGTPLMAAIWGNLRADTSAVFKMLLKNGANVNARTKAGGTPLMIAIERQRIDYVEDLVKHGADVNLADAQGRTPLMEALADRGAYDLVKFLIKHGADVNKVTKEGWGPLIELMTRNVDPDNKSIYQADMASLELLLKNKVNVNAKCQGQTPLMFAVRNKNVQYLQALIDHGTKVDIVDDDMKTALFYAKEKMYSDEGDEMIAILKKATLKNALPCCLKPSPQPESPQ